MFGRLFRIPFSHRSRKRMSFSTLRAAASKIRAELREVDGPPTNVASLGDVTRGLNACRVTVQDIAEQTKAAFERLADKRTSAGDYFRLLQATYGAYHRPKTPDWMNTVLLVMVFWLLEGGIAGAILISEGRMDVPAGLAYGLIFALVNIVLGLLIGYLPIRYLNFRNPLELSEPETGQRFGMGARFIRGLSVFGVTVGLSVEAILIYGAARLRALGTHEGVWDTSEVGVLETFDDSLAIIIAVIGTCSVILALMKGYSGISDPIPGFSDAYIQATADIDDVAEDMGKDAEDAIETVCEAALERAEDQLSEAQDGPTDALNKLTDIARAIDLFNDDVRAAQDAAHKGARKRRGLAAFVTGHAAKPAASQDRAAFEALILPSVDAKLEALRAASTTDAAPVEAAMAELEATRNRCLAEVRAAHAAFRASAPNLDALIDEEGDHHG